MQDACALVHVDTSATRSTVEPRSARLESTGEVDATAFAADGGAGGAPDHERMRRRVYDYSAAISIAAFELGTSVAPTSPCFRQPSFNNQVLGDQTGNGR